MRSKAKATLLCLIAGLTLLPLPQVIAPAWDITIVDKQDVPIGGVSVTESWAQLSLGGSASEQFMTDASGTVHFDRRVRFSMPLMRFVGCLHNFASQTFHASCGTDSFVVVAAGVSPLGYGLFDNVGLHPKHFWKQVSRVTLDRERAEEARRELQRKRQAENHRW